MATHMLHQLENNEFVLMMYIAGELPEEERREVEGMLKTDEKLREQYESIRGAWTSSMAGLEAVDGRETMAFSREVAARKVGRMVRQWHAAKMKPEPVVAPAPKYRWPWWAIASTSMAASVIGFLVWWGTSVTTISWEAAELGRWRRFRMGEGAAVGLMGEAGLTAGAVLSVALAVVDLG